MCAVSNPHLSFAAGFGTFSIIDRLPGFIGPFPPPLLIRLYAINKYILRIFVEKSILFSTFFLQIVYKSDIDIWKHCC